MTSPGGRAGDGWRPVVAFVLATFAWTRAWWIPMVATGSIAREGQGWPTHALGLLGPAVGAVVTTARYQGRYGMAELWSRVTRWRVAPRWWALVAATALLVLLPLLLDADVRAGDFFRYSGLPAIGLFTVVYALVVNGFGEEIGWRGFLAEHLLGRFSLALTSLLVWVVWRDCRAVR